MNLDIFDSTKHWIYTADDQLAEVKFQRLAKEARTSLPKQFFDRNAPNFLKGMRKTKIYELLKTMPKGVLHNVFFDCCEDRSFYRNIIAKHPNVYVTQDFVSFRVGSAEEAQRHGWVSMAKGRKLYKNDQDFIQALFGITTFTEQQKIATMKKDKPETWNIFERKINNLGTLIYVKDIFVQYVSHVLRKFIANGYQRVQFRAQLVRLSDYDENGQFLGKLPEKCYAELFEQAAKQIEWEYPDFTVGIIFGVRKSLPEEEIKEGIQKIFQLNWQRVYGIDFYQEQDLYGSMSKYNKMVDQISIKYPDVRLWKCYHAGETKNPLSRNIQEAVLAGSVRIGHGLNILQRVQFLPFCKHICFEKCPLSNLLMGYTGDPRQSSGPTLLGLGYAVSINMGDSGKLGAQDSTSDFFVSAISYDWTLKHFKLVIQHSINHCLVRESNRRKIIRKFNQNWNKWVTDVLQGEHKSEISFRKSLDIFTRASNWCWTPQDDKAEEIFQRIRKRQISELPPNFYSNSLVYLKQIRSSEIYDLLKDMPKGVLHHLHFDCCQDEQFYKEHIITDPNIYLDKERKHFVIGPKQEAEEKGWVSFPKLAEQFPDQRKFISFVANLTMLHKQELQVVSGKQHEFWILFEQKISNFFPLVFTLHIYKKYVKHVLLKYIRNGYSRVEFRALLVQLGQYDQNGNFVKTHDEKMYMTAFDQVYAQVQKDHPEFTSAFVFFGLKMDSQEVNFQRLDKVCSYEWPKTIGIDFVQQEDPYGSMQPYIRVGDRIVKKWAHQNLKKVYHAGQTKDHTNNNVELSVRSGCVRIGHGLNIVKRIEYLPQCKHICFELNPISNLLTGGMTDIRMSTAPLLLGLGYSVSISPDDPGKFGYQDTTVDLYASAVSFNWTLRHFKLIGFHAINHAIVTEGEKLNLLENFNKNWNKWAKRLIDLEKQQRVQWPKRGAVNKLETQQMIRRCIPVIVNRTNSL